MKRLRPSIHREFTGVRLYLEDVQRILKTMQEIASEGGTEEGDEPDGVTIQTEAFEYESLEELRINEESPPKMVMRSHDPHLELEVSRLSTSIHAYKPDLAVSGAALRIEEIVRSRRLWWRAAAYRTSLSVLVGAVAVANAVVQFEGHGGGGVRSWWVGVLVAGVVWGFFLLGVATRRSPPIILRKRSEMPSFLKRNRDALLVGALSSVFGAVLGSLVTNALTRH